MAGTGGTSAGRDEMGWGMGPSKQRQTRLSQAGVNGGVRAGKGAGPALNTSHRLHGDAFFLLLLTGYTMANVGVDCPRSVEMQLWARPQFCVYGEERGPSGQQISPGLQVSVTAARFYQTCTLPRGGHWFLLVLEPTPEQS